MNLKRHLLEAATLVIAAVLCAVVSNAIAARERKVVLVGNYPNATKVPVRDTSSVDPMATSATPATATTPGVPATATTSTAAAVPPGAAIETVGLNPNAPNPARTGTAPKTTTAATTTAPPTVASPAPTTASPAPANLEAMFAPHPDKPYVEIHGDDVAKLHAAGALFLDARRTSVYEQGHIAGARPFSVWESDIDEKVNKLFEERSDPRQQALPIVVYCTGGDCEDSHMLAQKLWGIQFNNVYVYKDGFPDWQKRGGAIRNGGTP